MIKLAILLFFACAHIGTGLRITPANIIEEQKDVLWEKRLLEQETELVESKENEPYEEETKEENKIQEGTLEENKENGPYEEETKEENRSQESFLDDKEVKVTLNGQSKDVKDSPLSEENNFPSFEQKKE